LKRDAVAVAAGELQDRLDAGGGQHGGGDRRAHMGAGAGPVGEVDGVSDAAQRQRLAHQIVAVARHRRRDLGGHDEASGAQQFRKPRGAGR
jgi:hypothetical protein